MEKTSQLSGLSDYELELDNLADKIKSTNSSLECIVILKKFINKKQNETKNLILALKEQGT